MRSFIILTFLLAGCAPTVPCSKIDNLPFGDRLSLANELPKDGLVSQKVIENHVNVLEACGFK